MQRGRIAILAIHRKHLSINNLQHLHAVYCLLNKSQKELKEAQKFGYPKKT